MSKSATVLLVLSLAVTSLAGCGSSGYTLRDMRKAISSAPAIEFVSVVNLPNLENGAYTVRGDEWINEVEVTRRKSGELWSASLYEADLSSNKERITVYSSRTNTTDYSDGPLDTEKRSHWKSSYSYRFVWDIDPSKAEYVGQKVEYGTTWDIFRGRYLDQGKSVERSFEVRVSVDRKTWIETYADKNGVLVCIRQGIMREEMARPEWFPSSAEKMVDIFEKEYKNSFLVNYPIGKSFWHAEP